MGLRVAAKHVLRDAVMRTRMSQEEELDIPLSECCIRLSTDEQKQGCTCNNVSICLYESGA
jgi:hypothetical protein